MRVRRRPLAALISLTLIPSALVVTAATPQASAAVIQSYAIPATGSIQVVGHGNGHGHGLSQYGAHGAALAGLNYKQILAFYYPGTALKTIPSSTTLRVKISGGKAKTCVQNKAGLSIVGQSYKFPPASEIKSVRLAPSGTGFKLRAFRTTACTGTITTKYDWASSAAELQVKSTGGFVRLMLSGGYWTEYWGTIGAVRSGSGQLTINKVNVDRYAEGVAPRESPASWGVTALSAQAVAARTYAEYERQHAHAGSLYDICDTSSCQVYGGKAHSGSGGTWNDYPAAIASNKGQILTYKGAVAFTQYSASNGGRTADGGQPYMIAKADPYDNARSGDPYLSIRRDVAVSSLARAFGLRTVTAIDITGRDAGSTGYVTSAIVYGTNSAGAAVSKATTGYTLQSVFGLSSTYFTIQSAPPSNLTSYVSAVHRLITGVGPTGAQSVRESTLLAKGTTAAAYAMSVANSNASLQQQVRQVFAAVHRKSPSAATIARKIKVIKRTGYLRFEVNQFAASSYYHRVGGRPLAWVRSVYESPLVYGKKASTATLGRLAKQLKSGTRTRQQIAEKIITSMPVLKYQARVDGRHVLGHSLPAGKKVRNWAKAFARDGYVPQRLMAVGLAQSEIRKRYGLKR